MIMFTKFRSSLFFLLLAALLLVGCQTVTNEGSAPLETPLTVEAIWPPDGESVDPNPILQWATFPGADHYQIVVLDDDAFPPAVSYDESTMDTLFAVPQPLEPGSYSWTVFARNANDDDLAQSGRQFWVRADLTLLEPANGARVSATPTLRWAAFPDAVQYQVIILNSDAYPPVVVLDEVVTTTNLAVSEPLVEGVEHSLSILAQHSSGRILAESNTLFTVGETAVAAATGAPQISLDTGSLATGFATETVTPSPDGPYWELLPAYTQLTLQGYPLNNHLMRPQIFVYPVAELQAINEGARSIVASLQTLIQSPQEIPLMPFLPLYNAQQVMHAHLQYLDFQDGQGLRYLTQFDQAFIPINNYELIYTYQGLTGDGKYYVAAVFPVHHPSLPPDGNVTGNEPPQFTTDFPAYIANVVASLNPQAANTFTPDLTQLDAMMRSLEIK
jgi:hypothetical protein